MRVNEDKPFTFHARSIGDALTILRSYVYYYPNRERGDVASLEIKEIEE